MLLSARPTIWHAWIYLGAANPNFYYFACMVLGVAQVGGLLQTRPQGSLLTASCLDHAGWGRVLGAAEEGRALDGL